MGYIQQLSQSLIACCRLRQAHAAWICCLLALRAACPTELAAAEKEPDYRKLVAGLVSPNQPPECEFDGPGIAVPPKYDWKAQGQIEKNRRVLYEHCKEAVPFLIEACTDDRYSLTSRWSEDDVFYNRCVGEVCLIIIEKNVEQFREFMEFADPGEWHDYDFVPHLNSAIGKGVTSERKKEIQDWWRSRKQESLRELQIEAFDWAVRKRSAELVGLSDSDKKSEEGLQMARKVKKILTARDKLKRSKKCLPPAEMWGSVDSPNGLGFRIVPWEERDKLKNGR
jgi:hypothetical protein